MSTSYYRLKPPITSVRADSGGSHTILGIWVNHAKAGEITLRNEEVSDVLRVMRADSLAITRFARHDGYGYDFCDDDVEIDTPLVSESGEIVTLADLGMTEEQRWEYRL